MPAPRKLIPSDPIEVHLPQDLAAQVKLYLFSELEGRVPKGAYQTFFSNLVREHFNWKRVDLAPYAATPPGAFVVAGSPDSIAVLIKTLKGEVPA